MLLNRSVESFFLLVVALLFVVGIFSLGAIPVEGQSGARCNTYSEGSTPPAGYGAAWDVLSSTRMHMLHSYCRFDGSFNFTVGHPDAPDTWYVYKQGYYYSGSWKPFTLSGEFVESSTDWLLREGYLSLDTPPARPFFWVGYVCQWTGSQWKCGCRDQACTQNYWQLQQATSPNSGGGGVGGNDTFSCLSDFSGPTKTVSGNQGYDQYRTTNWSNGTKFDARNATFRAKWNPSIEQAMNIILGGNWRDAPEASMCWAGGTITGENPTNETWCKNYSSNAFGISVNARNSVVTGMRLHNMHDAIRFTSNGSVHDLNFTIKDNWVTYNRDDCIENDGMHGGTIEDNLFDGCYVFYSAVDVKSSRDGSSNTVEVRNNVVRLEAMPGPRQVGGSCDAGKTGYGMLWKIGDGDTPNLSIHDNIFLLEEGSYPAPNGGWMQGDRDSRIVSCSNNTVVWAGSGSPPKTLVDRINLHGNCFTLSTDTSLYETAKQQWINRHQ